MAGARRLILAGGVLAALSLAPAVAEAATRYTVTGSTVTVRNGPADYTASGYVIGTTYGSSGAGPNVSSQGTFDLIRKSANGSWGYGFVHGGFGSWGDGHCGWVLMSELHTTDTFSNRYPGALPAGRGTSGHAGVTSGYSGFGTRYETADHHAWLIKDSQSPAGAGRYSVPTWHFVRAECITRIS